MKQFFKKDHYNQWYRYPIKRFMEAIQKPIDKGDMSSQHTDRFFEEQRKSVLLLWISYHGLYKVAK
jgi:hypothetical protein